MAALVVGCLAGPLPASELVFEGAGARMVVPLSELSEVVAGSRADGMNEVVFQMNARDAERFEALTTRLEGQRLTLSYCGQVLARPTVLAPIEGGSVLITGGTDQGTAALFEALQGRRACPE